jgi:bromodomain-containing factor 1
MSSLAIDATLASPANVTTADTSMSDAAQSPVKVARGRDEDEEDGPAAKRVKTDPPSDVVEVRTSPEDAMAVDQKGADETALYKEDGRPKTLADPSLDGNPITRYQANRLRVILAGIKKTKAGVNFKAPVRSMWPQLWDEYRLKVTEPTDISTMERRLKSAGDPEYPPYENMGAFKKDLELIYTNSVRFNGELHTVTQQAKTMQDQVLERMASFPAVESSVDEKKAPKQHPTRHTEPRTAAQSSPAQPPRRPSKPAVPSPVDKTAQSPAFAIPPNNHGIPLIRRDSTKNVDDRPKRPVHPPKSKDFGYDVKKKKKLSPELRFCSEVLDELTKVKHHQYNVYFLRPVDPIAEHIPNYFKMIRRPMDLETMGEKLSTGQYTSARDFEKDFFQIVKNANIFNGPDHHVTASAHQLADVFREEWAKKDAWMAKRAPQAVSQAQASAAASRAVKDEEDEEDEADSEDEAEEKQAETSSRHLEVLQQRLKEENDKLNEQMNAKVPDINMVDVQQSMIALLQKQIIQERQKLAAAAPPAKKGGGANSKPAAKAKKSGGGSKKRLPTAQGGGASGAAGGEGSYRRGYSPA